MSIYETNRLYIRELALQDMFDLREILQDIITMRAYEHAFSDAEVQAWYEKQQQRYRKDGFGLWAVIRKKDNQMIGQCGLTWQQIGSENGLEIGYLFKRSIWHQGYARETAIGCKHYAFHVLHATRVYSIIRDININSRRVAIGIGMHKVATIVKHYYGMDMPHDVYMTENEDNL